MSQNSNLNKKFPPKTILFNEGDQPASMFLIRNGMIRIFKTKADGFIEIDTLRAGQIVGEISFLDNNPRSASAETLTECELVEISKSLYQNTVSSIPEWLVALIRAIAARLRATTTKLKNLEQAGSAVDYEEDGNSKISYAFLPAQEAMKLAVTILACLESAGVGGKVKFSKIESLAGGVFNISISKIAAFLECLREAQIVSFEPSDDVLTFNDTKAIEEWIQFTLDESNRDASAKRTLTERGLKALEIIEGSLIHFPVDSATETSLIDLAKVKSLDQTNEFSDSLRPHDLEELVTKGYFSQLKVVSGNDQTAVLNPTRISKLLRIQRLTRMLEVMNSQRSNPGRRN